MKSLSKKDNHRKSLLRNLVTSLILYEQIKTTKTRAKEIKSIFEHLISIAKKDNLCAQRQIKGYVFDDKASRKIFEVLTIRYKNISSGYIKSYNIGQRIGDNAQMVILRLNNIINPNIVKQNISNIEEKNVSKTKNVHAKKDNSSKK